MKNILRLTTPILFAFAFLLISCKDKVIPVDPNDNTKKTDTLVTIVGRTIYVSPNGNISNTGLTENSPITLSYAASVSNPGDKIYLLSGDYVLTSGISIQRSGLVNGYITYAAAPGNKPVLKVTNPTYIWNTLEILANYIKIDGLELIGNNANLTLAQGVAIYNEAVAGGTDWGKYGQTNTNGIVVGNHATIVPHHVFIKNCKIHDFAGCGIGCIKSDFMTIENNIIYNNVWYGMYASSGISIFHSTSTLASYTDYSMIVRNNTVYNNKALVKWISTKTYSDGNGIIIDDNKNTQISATPYKGKFLVENNISYSNGGSGIYVMSSERVTFLNNTSYWNSTERATGTGAGELVCFDSNDVIWVNNIAWSNPAYGDVNAIVDDGNWGSNNNITWRNNLTYTGTPGQRGVRIAKTTTTSIDSSNKLGVNPLFVNPGVDFRLQTGSPAINAGYNGYASKFDILGVARPQGGIVDLGAYEMQ